jgi:hypothetical protein
LSAGLDLNLPICAYPMLLGMTGTCTAPWCWLRWSLVNIFPFLSHLA